MIPKFRAWDKIQKIMHYDVQNVYDGSGSTIDCDYFGYVINAETEDEYGVPIPDTRIYVVMQYTGLLDKNKSELYDKDIVRIWNEDFEVFPQLAVVTWDRTGQWVFDFGDDEPLAAPDIFNDLSAMGIDEVCSSTSIEKVGNIFENENLLTNKLKQGYSKHGK